MVSFQSDVDSLPTQAMLDDGLYYFEAGELSRAQVLYDRVLVTDPDHAGCLHRLGLIAQQANSPARAAEYLLRAVGLEPDNAIYHNDLGNVLRDLGRYSEAIGHFLIALCLRPCSPEIHSNLGNALRDTGRIEEAATHYRLALRLAPELADVHYNLGNVLCELDRLEEGESCYREALRLRPGFADAWYNLGNALIRLYRPASAEAALREALWLRAGHPETLNNLGVILQEQGRLDEAVNSYLAALCLKPSFAEAHYNLGCAYLVQGRQEEAGCCFQQALSVNPQYGAARLALCAAQLPILYSSEEEIGQRRRAYEAALRALAGDVELGLIGRAELAEAVGACQPFFLAYQGHDDKELQCLYGSLISQVLANTTVPGGANTVRGGASEPVARPVPGCRAIWRGERPALWSEGAADTQRPRRAGRRIRVGIVSGYYYDHTIWRLFLSSWLRYFERDRFELFAYHTGIKRDPVTDEATCLCEHFIEGRRPARRWRHQIAVDAPQVLLYPEIGMDPVAAQLAAQRLAPVQCVCWGHPTTSGMPTMDYFLSSELMEPPGAERHYLEDLIVLPNLGICYQPDTLLLPEIGRQALGLRPDATVYWSGQALYKYLPQYDVVFPRIASLVGNCQFVFIAFANTPQITGKFHQRLCQAFAAYGLDAEDYCVILPQMPQERFLAAACLADVILDTIGWSGGRSTLDCLVCKTPIVTMTGPLMRGCHTAAILRRLGVTETITTTVDSYVNLAARLARDPGWRAALGILMAERKERAFHDFASLSALEDFLEWAAHRATTGEAESPGG